MSQGKSNKAACRIVDINIRTGKRWRHGRKRSTSVGTVRTYPAIMPTPVISVRFLSEDERIAIADGVLAGQSARAIARELRRSASTVCREIRRNRDPDTDRYHPFRAHSRAAGRRPRPKPGKLVRNTQLHAFVNGGLEKRWSPEQISKALPKLFPDRPEMRVAHETIYQALYVQGRGELRRELHRALRSGRARRKPHRRGDQRTGRFADPMLMISERPAEVADRAVPGHWEGDLLMGQLNRSAIGTLVERTTRYVMLLHLADGHGPEHLRDALVQAVSALPSHLARSLTWDQGTEMHRHRQFTVATDIPVYFCDPASPWQRGSNENTNGLLRQYFPKGTDLRVHDPGHLITVAAELNSRPRKTLDWDTPAERLDKLLEPTD
ncbi:MAG: IS30 family transposase [Acidimicrobiales bacterium]